MELVYLWVEKYKNIQLKGFNLSPKFECKYEPNNLTIIRKEYTELFPDNINITAFIGANGSGKTSLLEIIQLLCLDSIATVDVDEHIWGIFYDKVSDKFYCESLISENIGFHSIIIKDINNSFITNNYKLNRTIEKENGLYYFHNVVKNIFYNIWYNPSTELVSSKFLNYINNDSKEFYGHIFDLDFKPPTINTYAFPSKDKGIINIKKNENIIILNMFKMKDLVENIDIQSLFKSEKFIFIPKRVYFKINHDELEYNIKQQYIREIIFQNQLTLNIKDLYRYYLAMLFSSIEIDYKDQSFKEYFLKDSSVIKKYLIKKYNETSVNNTDYNYSLKKMYQEIYKNIDEVIMLTENVNLHDELVENSTLNFNVHDIAKLIDTMKKNNIKTFPHSTSDKDMILILLKYLPSFIEIEVYDTKSALFNDFSYGEKNIIQLLYSLLYYIVLFKEDKVLNIILDEIELGLNPKWQKELISVLLKFLKIDVFTNIKFNIFLSSHSPFILSDIPKENIVFLKNGEEDFPFSNNQNTFGANIHTLLAHGFFMDNGLMGEFAKEKINEVIANLLNKSKSLSKEQLKSIIKIVGEPFLKVKLEQMYNEKFGIDDEIAKLQKEQEKINLRIENLKKQKSENAES